MELSRNTLQAQHQPQAACPLGICGGAAGAGARGPRAAHGLPGLFGTIPSARGCLSGGEQERNYPAIPPTPPTLLKVKQSLSIFGNARLPASAPLCLRAGNSGLKVRRTR